MITGLIVGAVYVFHGFDTAFIVLCSIALYAILTERD